MQKSARTQRYIRNIVSRLAAILFIGAAVPAWAMDKLLVAGTDPAGPAVTFRLETAGNPAAIYVQVESCGIIGANASIYIDNAKIPAYSHLLTESECRTSPKAGTACQIHIEATQEAYRMVMMVLRLGSKVRVKIEAAGKVLFDQSAPLGDFAQDLES